MKRYKWKKILNVIHAYVDLLLAREKPRSLPTELSIGTTSFCNLKCIMCPREGSDGNVTPFDEHIEYDYFVELQPYLERAKEISLYGLGEPMIDRGYFEKVRFVNSFGGEVSLSSNGTLLDEKRCREVIDSGIAAIGISLDAVCEETFRVVRPPGGFDAIAENIRRLTRLKKEMGASRPLVKVSFGVMKQNLHDAPRFPEFVASVGGDEIVMHPTIYQSQYAVEQLGVPRQQLLEAIAEARANAERVGVPFHFWDLDTMSFLKSLEYGRQRSETQATPEAPHDRTAHSNGKGNGKPHTRYFCFFLWRNAMIQGKGELFPCCYMSNLKVGRVENGNLRDLRGHPMLAEMRQDLFEGRPPAPCQSCPQMQPYDRWHIFKSGLKEVRHLIRSL